MTEHDRPAFAMALAVLGETFNEPMSETRAEAYFDSLRDLSLEAVVTACRGAMRNARFFPRPIELREVIEGAINDRAECAWLELLRLVRRHGWLGTDGKGTPPAFADDATRRAAIDLFGSWPALCERLPSSGPEFLGLAKHFKTSFAAYARRDQRHVYLPPSRDDARKQLLDLRAELTKRGLPTGALDTMRAKTT